MSTERCIIRAECPMGRALAQEVERGKHGPVRLVCQTGGELCHIWCNIFPASTNPPGFALRGVIFGECFAMDNFYGGAFTDLHEQVVDQPDSALLLDTSQNIPQESQDGP
jgi:hypothetical protein